MNEEKKIKGGCERGCKRECENSLDKNREMVIEKDIERNMDVFKNININEIISDIINKLIKGVVFYDEDIYGNKVTSLYVIPNITFNDFVAIINCDHTISKRTSKELFYGCYVYLYHKKTLLCIKVLYDINRKQIMSIAINDISELISTINNIQSS